MRKNEEKLADILQAVLGRSDIKENLDRVAIENFWKQEMGPMINKYTKSFRFHRGILSLEISSAPLRQELSGSRAQLRKRINDALGREAVVEVRVF